MEPNGTLGSALTNTLLSIVGGVVLGALGRIYKSVSSLYRRVEIGEERQECITDHLGKRDQFKLPARLRFKENDSNLGN